MTELRVTVVGVEELQRVCTPELYQPSIRRILMRTAIMGENLGKERAPVNLGRLRASVAHEVDASDSPTWARYGTNVRYGLYLNSPVTRNPHYRSGPRQGSSTRDWLTGTLPDVTAYATSEIAAEVNRIEAAWST